MTRRFCLAVIAIALLAVVILAGIALAYNCVDTIKYDAYWGDPHVGVPGHYDDANLHCTVVAGWKYQCPDPSKYPVNHTAEVGAIMVLEPTRCGAAGLIYDDQGHLIGGGHVGIVVGVSSGSIQVYEQGWGNPGAPGTFTHTYPCDGMWFIHREDTIDTVDGDGDGIPDTKDKGDFNGDGYSDLFHSADPGHAYFWPGSSSGPHQGPQVSDPNYHNEFGTWYGGYVGTECENPCEVSPPTPTPTPTATPTPAPTPSVSPSPAWPQ